MALAHPHGNSCGDSDSIFDRISQPSGSEAVTIPAQFTNSIGSLPAAAPTGQRSHASVTAEPIEKPSVLAWIPQAPRPARPSLASVPEDMLFESPVASTAAASLPPEPCHWEAAQQPQVSGVHQFAAPGVQAGAAFASWEAPAQQPAFQAEAAPKFTSAAQLLHELPAAVDLARSSALAAAPVAAAAAVPSPAPAAPAAAPAPAPAAAPAPAPAAGSFGGAAFNQGCHLSLRTEPWPGPAKPLEPLPLHQPDALRESRADAAMRTPVRSNEPPEGYRSPAQGMLQGLNPHTPTSCSKEGPRTPASRIVQAGAQMPNIIDVEPPLRTPLKRPAYPDLAPQELPGLVSAGSGGSVRANASALAKAQALLAEPDLSKLGDFGAEPAAAPPMAATAQEDFLGPAARKQFRAPRPADISPAQSVRPTSVPDVDLQMLAVSARKQFKPPRPAA